LPYRRKVSIVLRQYCLPSPRQPYRPLSSCRKKRRRV
jgi:hypothetical protein